MSDKAVPVEKITAERKPGLISYRDTGGNELIHIPGTENDPMPIYRLTSPETKACEIDPLLLNRILAQLNIPNGLKYDDDRKATFFAPVGVLKKAKAFCVPETPTR